MRAFSAIFISVLVLTGCQSPFSPLATKVPASLPLEGYSTPSFPIVDTFDLSDGVSAWYAGGAGPERVRTGSLYFSAAHSLEVYCHPSQNVIMATRGIPEPATVTVTRMKLNLTDYLAGIPAASRGLSIRMRASNSYHWDLYFNSLGQVFIGGFSGTQVTGGTLTPGWLDLEVRHDPATQQASLKLSGFPDQAPHTYSGSAPPLWPRIEVSNLDPNTPFSVWIDDFHIFTP